MEHRFHPTILRAYDIRGIIGATLHEADAYALGLGFATLVVGQGGKRIAVGRDGRLSSPMLAEQLIEGLVSGGAEVLDLGLAPTPMLYFADLHLKTDAAIEVTGSHNPANHNGFKMVLNHQPFFGDAITALGARIASGITPATSTGTVICDNSMQEQWLDSIVSAMPPLTNLAEKTIFWDCGNGVMGPSVAALTPRLLGTHHILFGTIDGSFPHHHPDPTKIENLKQLQAAMAQHNSASTAGCGTECLGIGFDGDGDRIGVIDGRGRHSTGDMLTAYLARSILRQCPGAEIIFDVKASTLALDVVRGLGGRPVLCKTGHSHMKALIHKTGAPLGGEMSGHICINHGYFGFDDALFVACAVLREWHESGVSLGGFIDTLPPQFITPEISIACPDEDKFALTRAIIQDVTANPDPDQQAVIDIDGIRVESALGWWLIRASNTTANLIIRAEGRDAEALAAINRRIASRLKTVGLQYPQHNQG